MAALTDRDQRHLRQMAWMQPGARWVGVLACLAGIAYGAWAVLSFDYRVDPRDQPSFDRAVLKIAAVYDPYSRTIDKITPETSIEGLLLDRMQAGLRFSTSVMVLMLRLFLGALVLLFGLVSLTVAVERGRLLRLIERLSAPEDP